MNPQIKEIKQKGITFEEIRNILKENEPILKDKFEVKEIGIFGSWIRGEQKKDSDIDILIDFEPEAKISLLDFVGLENYMSDLLGAKVDLVEKPALKPRIGKHILREVVYLL